MLNCYHDKKRRETEGPNLHLDSLGREPCAANHIQCRVRVDVRRTRFQGPWVGRCRVKRCHRGWGIHSAACWYWRGFLGAFKSKSFSRHEQLSLRLELHFHCPERLHWVRQRKALSLASRLDRTSCWLMKMVHSAVYF